MDAILAILNSRSYSSIWFWILVVGFWSIVGRNVLGVPSECFAKLGIRRADQDSADDLRTGAGQDFLLLDWLSLQLPRWQVRRNELVVLFGIGIFVLTLLFVLGFGHQLELAQALFLLAAPYALLTAMRLRLAARLTQILAGAQQAQLAPQTAAEQAAAQMRRHRLLMALLSIFVVAITAFLGAVWMLRHPYGF